MSDWVQFTERLTRTPISFRADAIYRVEPSGSAGCCVYAANCPQITVAENYDEVKRLLGIERRGDPV